MHGRQCQPPEVPSVPVPQFVSTTCRDALSFVDNKLLRPRKCFFDPAPPRTLSRAKVRGLSPSPWLLLRPPLPSSRQLAWLLAEPRTNRGPSPVSHQCPVPSESLVWQGLPRCMTDPQPDPLLIHRPLATRLFPPPPRISPQEASALVAGTLHDCGHTVNENVPQQAIRLKASAQIAL